MPGYGFIALHFAHAHSVDGIVLVSPMTPATVSDACVVNVACAVSSVKGL